MYRAGYYPCSSNTIAKLRSRYHPLRRCSMGWILLIVAIVLEVAGTTNMKLSEGFSKLVPSVLVLFFYALSIITLTFAVNRLDVSVAYAVWSGMGTALVAVIGLWYFQESLTLMKVLALGLIIVGVVMLHLTSESH